MSLNLSITVIPRAKRNEVWEKEGQLICRVTAAPEDGKANEAVKRLLADYFSVPVSRVRIIRGQTSRNKIVEY